MCMLLPLEAIGQAAHTATPSAATPASADMAEPALSAASHPRPASTVARTATATAVPTNTHRRAVIAGIVRVNDEQSARNQETIPYQTARRAPPSLLRLLRLLASRSGGLALQVDLPLDDSDRPRDRDGQGGVARRTCLEDIPALQVHMVAEKQPLSCGCP